MTSTVFAYVLVTLSAGSEKDVLKTISNLKEVVEVNLMYGGYDVIVKVMDCCKAAGFKAISLSLLESGK